MSTKTEFLVRLKPRPKKARKDAIKTPSRYMVRGIRFEEKIGWYRINDAALAKLLRNLTHNDQEDGVLLFDVCTPAEAAQIQAREAKAGRARASVEDPREVRSSSAARTRSGRGGALTSGDLKPDAEPAEPPMIDPDPDGAELEAESEEEADSLLGRLDGDVEQELDDSDDLLDGDREPAAPVVREKGEAPQTRKKAAKKKAKKAS